MPLLNVLKTSAQVAPSTARRLARVLRSHSITQPSGFTYFHRSRFLLPMVVSSVTCGGRCVEGPPDVRPGLLPPLAECCSSRGSYSDYLSFETSRSGSSAWSSPVSCMSIEGDS